MNKYLDKALSPTFTLVSSIIIIIQFINLFFNYALCKLKVRDE